jgi:enoyl-CoA hydratase/carnithine racemase
MKRNSPHMAGSIVVRRDGAVAWVTLSHPGKFNAMSRGMWLSLKSHFEDLSGDADLRCIVVQGEGGHFCAGGDIAEYPGFRFDAQQLQIFHEAEVWGGLQAMLDRDVPIVAQIQGNCMGAGVEIASCCDLRLASTLARFGAPIARLGFPMAPREAALVARAVGDTTARAMLLAAEVFDADHMQAQGFLLRTFADGELADHVQALAHRMAGLAPQAARMNKQTFRALNGPVSPEEFAQAAIKNVADQTSEAYAYADSPEHREGVQAFLEKRSPNF